MGSSVNTLNTSHYDINTVQYKVAHGFLIKYKNGEDKITNTLWSIFFVSSNDHISIVLKEKLGNSTKNFFLKCAFKFKLPV